MACGAWSAQKGRGQRCCQSAFGLVAESVFAAGGIPPSAHRARYARPASRWHASRNAFLPLPRTKHSADRMVFLPAIRFCASCAGSFPNRTAGPRRAAVVNYFGDGCAYLHSARFGLAHSLIAHSCVSSALHACLLSASQCIAVRDVVMRSTQSKSNEPMLEGIPVVPAGERMRGRFFPLVFERRVAAGKGL